MHGVKRDKAGGWNRTQLACRGSLLKKKIHFDGSGNSIMGTTPPSEIPDSKLEAALSSFSKKDRGCLKGRERLAAAQITVCCKHPLFLGSQD
jgi:hypothetical protein